MVIIKRTEQGIKQKSAGWLVEELALANRSKKARELYATQDPDIFASNIRFDLPDQYTQALQFASKNLMLAEAKFSVKQLVLELGSPRRTITIKADGKGSIYADDSHEYSVSVIRGLIEAMKGMETKMMLTAQDWSGHRLVKWQKVWIGCGEGSEFTVGELEEIVVAYENLQKGL